MFVSTNKFNKMKAELSREISDLRVIVVEIVGGKKFQEAIKRLENKGLLSEENSLENYELAFEDLENPALHDKDEPKKLPSRKEYDARVEEAIKLFQARKNRSDVERLLQVSRKTARKYLNIAIAKRKVRKADFDELNQ